ASFAHRSRYGTEACISSWLGYAGECGLSGLAERTAARKRKRPRRVGAIAWGRKRRYFRSQSGRKGPTDLKPPRPCQLPAAAVDGPYSPRWASKRADHVLFQVQIEGFHDTCLRQCIGVPLGHANVLAC